MPKSNLEIIKSTYEGSASSNAKHLAEALSEKVEWTEAEGFPYGGTYTGVEAIMENVFSRFERFEIGLQSLCLGLGGDNPLVKDERRSHVGEESLAMSALAAEMINCFIVSHR